MHKIQDEIIFPDWIKPPFRQCQKRLDDQNAFLHLAMKGLSKITLGPEVIEYFRKYPGEGDRKRDWDSEIDKAKKDAAWVEKEIIDGFPILHSQSAVALWSILEVLCEDLIVCWITNKGSDAWQIPQISRLKINIGEYESLPDNDKPRYIVIQLERALSTEFKTGVGRLEPLLEIIKFAPQIGPNVRRALHELFQVRNVIVHCGAIADRKLLSECPWVSWRLNETIKIKHSLYGWYYRATMRYYERMMNQALIAFGNKGCECPGMNEISERPEEIGELTSEANK